MRRNDDMVINGKLGFKSLVTIRYILPDGSLSDIISQGSNITTIAGAGFLTRKIFEPLHDVEEVTPSYNTQLGLENDQPIPRTAEEYVYLFALGTGGCGKEPYQKYVPRYLSWIKPEELIPFKYVDLNADIPATLRETYFGRVERTTKVIYYFKRPENIEEPERVQRYIDGTPIDSSVYRNPREDEAETRVRLHLKATKDELRSFFRATTGINSARVNQVSLLTAYPKRYDGFTFYQNIRPLTLYNFNTIPLIDESLGIDIKYDLYL